MKLTENFILQEFVPKEIYEKYGETSIRFISEKLPTIAQGVRDYFDKSVTINDWKWGGNYNYSGFRPSNCGVGATNSAHKRGMAIDVKIKGIDSLEVQENVKKSFDYFNSLGITSMEEGTVGWTHLSMEWTTEKDLVLIKIP
jgi:hypothetical protein